MDPIPATAPHLPPSPPSRNPLKRVPLVHLIAAGLLAVCVSFGYIPKNDPPKADVRSEVEPSENADADELKRVAELNKGIRAANDRAEKTAKTELEEYNRSGKESAERRIAFFRFTAGCIAALWLVYSVITLVLRPVLQFIGRFLGPDFAAVISPLALLGIVSVLARTVLEWTGKGLLEKSWVAGWQQFVVHLLHPVCQAITGFADIVFKSWVAGTAYLLIVLYVVLKKFIKPVS